MSKHTDHHWVHQNCEEAAQLICELKELNIELENQLPKWTSVADYQPEVGVNYLCYCSNHGVVVSMRYEGKCEDSGVHMWFFPYSDVRSYLSYPLYSEMPDARIPGALL